VQKISKTKNMKTIILKLLPILLFSWLNFSCDIVNTEDLGPGISIYKTKGDYFNLITVGMKGDQVFRIYNYWSANDTFERMAVIGNDTVYQRRYKLPNGYVLDEEADERYDVFLNITCKEQFYREMHGVAFTNDTIKKYIIDRDPYLEYYRFRKDLPAMWIVDSLKIKQIILDGEIDKYFEKVK
jgi:hypothetical protein